MSIVSITQNQDIQQAIRAALDLLPLGDMFTDKIVAVKPNETWASTEDLTAVNDGPTLRAVLAYIKPRHPKRLLVTGGAGGCETEIVFRLSGMMDAVQEQGAEFVDTNKPPFTRVPLAFGPESELVVNPLVQQVEVWVSLSLLKVHSTTTVTLSMKNLGMALPAADHYGHPRVAKISHAKDKMSDFVVGVVQRFPIKLAITVGHPAMVDRGPIGGRTFPTGLVIASSDPVAADAIGAAILGYEPSGIRHITQAARLGLGEADLSRIEVRGLSLAEAIRRFQELDRQYPADRPAHPEGV
jgi:uncharacterized protein (DUF362 family)